MYVSTAVSSVPWKSSLSFVRLETILKMSRKYNILYNNVQHTGLINSRLLCSLYYFWEDKYFPKLIQLEKVVQVQLDNEQDGTTKTSEIPNEPPNILMPVHGHKLSRQHFISIRTHSFCFRKVNNSMPLLIISYLHWESLFEAHCGFNVYRDLSNGLKL